HSAPTTTPSSQPARTPPDLAGFLQLPVATPSTCPAGQTGSASGRRSPWVGHVDVSLFLSPADDAATISRVGRLLRADPLVRTVYYESQREAHAEFARLYTCWSAVPLSQTPA